MKRNHLNHRFLSALLALSLMVSLAAGIGGGTGDTPVAQAAGEYISYTDTTNKLIWQFQPRSFEGTLLAENLYVNSFYQDSELSKIPGNLTIPDYITVDSKNYTVSSLGAPGQANSSNPDADSFFGQAVSASCIPATITIDATACTRLETINTNALKGRSNVILMLPKTVKTVGAGVLGKTSTGGTANTIKCDAINTIFNNKNDVDLESGGFQFEGFRPSTAYDTFGPSILTNFSVSTECGDHSSFKFIIDSTGLNADTEDPVSPSIFPGSTTSYSAFAYKNDYSPSMNQLDSRYIPSRTYNTFDGYYYDISSGAGSSSTPTSIIIFDKDGNYVSDKTELTSISENEVVPLTAHWSPKPVTIKFDGNGSTSGSMPDCTATYGKELEIDAPTTSSSTSPAKIKRLPDNKFSKTGHTFDCWSTTATGTGGTTYTDKQDNVVFKANTTLYAQWKEKKYTVKYNPDYPSDASTHSLITTHDTEYGYDTNKNDPLESYTTLSAVGYTCKGWTADKTSNQLLTRVSEVIALAEEQGLTTINLYAVWQRNEYQVGFYDENGLVTGLPENPKTYKCNVNPGKLPVPSTTKTGYSFQGWHTSQYGEPKYPKDVDVTEDIGSPDDPLPRSLYAIYRANTYTIKYEKNTDDTEIAPMLPDSNIEYDRDVWIRDYCSYARSGCKFVGWSTTKDQPVLATNASDISIINATSFNFKDGSLSNPTSNLTAVDKGTVTLYPVWQREKYSISYNKHNESGTSVIGGSYMYSYEYGDTITLPTLSRTGYTFNGWLDESGNAVSNTVSGSSGNRTFTAKWNSDYIVKISGSTIQNVTTSTKTLVNNGTITGVTFKNGDSISNIRIRAVSQQLIAKVTITDESTGATRISRTIYSPTNEVTISDLVTFQSSNLVIAIEVKAVEYRITYNTNGGTIVGTAPSSYAYGTETKLPTNVMKDGSRFYGWKNAAGQFVTTITKTQTGDLIFDAVWDDPNIVGLPTGTTAAPSTNGRFLTLTYPNKTTEEVNLYIFGIRLVGGPNTIQFKLADGKTYMTTLNFIAAKEMPSTMRAGTTSDGTYAIITYADNITQQVVINKYNSEVTTIGTRLYFDALDGNRYVCTLGGTVDPVNPSPSPSPTPTTDPDTDDSSSNAKPKADEYYMISGISYNIRNKKATATNPSNWNAKSLTIKSSVSVYGKSYKVTKIAADAFYGMHSLTKITIGKNVTAIGARAFYYCNKLKTIYINSGKITSIGKNAFKRIAKNATITIKASKKKYNALVKLIKKRGCPKSTIFKRTS